MAQNQRLWCALCANSDAAADATDTVAAGVDDAGQRLHLQHQSQPHTVASCSCSAAALITLMVPTVYRLVCMYVSVCGCVRVFNKPDTRSAASGSQ